MREIVLEDNAVTLAEHSGWLAWKLVIAGKKGSPDRWFMKRGYLLIVEFKRQGETPDGNQVRRHRELREHGHKVHVIDTFAAFERLLEWADIESKRLADALRR